MSTSKYNNNTVYMRKTAILIMIIICWGAVAQLLPGDGAWVTLIGGICTFIVVGGCGCGEDCLFLLYEN